MLTIPIAWTLRLLLVFVASTVWWIFMSISDIPLQSFTLLYLRLYCITIVILICSLLLTVEYYLQGAEPTGSIAFYTPGVIICFGLSLLYPLVVITHWVFCSKLTWNHWLVLPLYILFGGLLFLIGRKLQTIATVIRWKVFVIGIALFHIYPSLIPGNIFGIIGAVLTVIATILSTSPDDPEKPGIFKVLASMIVHLAAGTTTVMSFVPMVLRKPTEDSDWTEFLQYSLSYVGAGKYAGNVEYHCYQTTDYYGVQVRT